MKRLKIILLFSLVMLFLNNLKITSNYNINDTKVIGTIIECSNEDSYTKLVIKGKEKIIAYYYNEYNCSLGDKIELEGTLSKIKSSQNFNLFDYQKYMLSKNIYWQLEVNEIKNIQKNNNIFYTIKNKIRKIANKNTYLALFILGENHLDDSVKESYQSNGISHLFAVSGMHVTLFITVLNYILTLVNKNKTINKMITVIFLLFYMFLTNFSISIVRASILTISLMAKDIFKFKISSLKILFYMFILFLSLNPYLIYQVGFIFTFIITFSFLLFSKYIAKYNHYLSKLFITSSIAFLISIPILINNFFQVNFLTPFLNIIFIPFVTFIIFPLSVLTFLFPLLLPLLENVTAILENLSLWCSNFEMLTFSFAKMPIYMLIIYYIIIYIGIYYFFQKKYYLVMLLPILIIHYNITLFKSSITLTIINIGQGDSFLIELEHNKGNILIDTGGNYYQNQTDNILIPYFKSIGVKKIDYLILTHGDYDHMGNSIDLINNFTVDKVILNCGEYNELEQNLIKVLNNKKIQYYSCIRELNINNSKLYFLNNGGYDNENDNSSVIYTNLNNYKFLFMGDASVEVENHLIKKYNLQNIDVLKVGHHGSKTSSSKNFIDKIKPQYSIISVGKNNRYNHPNNSVLDILENSTTYRTDENGSIIFKIKNNKLDIKTCSS